MTFEFITEHWIWLGSKRKIYETKCFFFPRNVIKIRSLSNTWNDKDVLMEETIFQLLVDYVEKEKCFETINWNSDPFHKETGELIQNIYNYIKIDRPILEKAEKDSLHEWSVSRDNDIRNFCKEHLIEYVNNWKRYNLGVQDSDKTKLLWTAMQGIERGLTASDTYMLTQIIKIRKSLWT